MRLIDADNLVPDNCDAEIEYGTKPVNFSANAIDLAQTVDAVPVVRCLECKHLMFSDCYGECGKGHMGVVRPDDFCSRGERKEGFD